MGEAMKGLLIRMNEPCDPRTKRVECAPRWAVVLVLGLNMTGCALLNPPPAPAPTPQPCTAEQVEIARLRQLLAEKELLIRSQQAQQREQTEVLQASSLQASRAQLKLSRLATQPEAASALAEVEVAMAAMHPSDAAAPEDDLLLQAQSFLAAANAAYTNNDFATSMQRATQAAEIIDMVKARHSRKASGTPRVTVAFQTGIPLRTLTDCNLRQLPRGNAKILGILKKDAALTALAYRGNWLRIQSEDGRRGWVLGTLLEARPDRP